MLGGRGKTHVIPMGGGFTKQIPQARGYTSKQLIIFVHEMKDCID